MSWSNPLPTLPLPLLREAVRLALLEDLGRAGDITSAATIQRDARARLAIEAREAGILCGVELAEEAFRAMDSGIAVRLLMADGDRLSPGAVVAEVEGPAQAILSGERTALNFLMHLSGVASLTHTYAERIAHTKARVTCTRKTVPGLRALQKYAVRCGGGSNHRFGLDDAILIKDNHVAVAGSVAEAVRRARAYAGHLVAGRAAVEASGNISLATIAAVAESGVDYISTSKITMAAPSLDLGLDIRIG